MQIALLGVGNIIYKDEGVGVYAANFIDKNYRFEHNISIIDGGTLGFKLMDYIQEYDKIVILDTISIDDEIGSIYAIPSEELLESKPYKQTAHEVEVMQVLESSLLLDKAASVKVLGIVPKDIYTMEIGLSSDIQSRFDSFVKAALDELKSLGVSYTKKEEPISLETIVKVYSNT